MTPALKPTIYVQPMHMISLCLGFRQGCNCELPR